MKARDVNFVMEVLEDALVRITVLDRDNVEEELYTRISKALNLLDIDYARAVEEPSLRPLNFHDPDDMMEFDGDDDD